MGGGCDVVVGSVGGDGVLDCGLVEGAFGTVIVGEVFAEGDFWAGIAAFEPVEEEVTMDA